MGESRTSLMMRKPSMMLLMGETTQLPASLAGLDVVGKEVADSTGQVVEPDSVHAVFS
jgi:hypothetical protein